VDTVHECDGQTDRITTTKTVQRIASHGKNLPISLQIDPNIMDLHTTKGTPPNFSRNSSGVGKIVDFQHLSRRRPISEMVQDGPSCYWPLIGICIVGIYICALSIGTKIDYLGWPWMATIHSVTLCACLSEPITKLNKKLGYCWETERRESMPSYCWNGRGNDNLGWNDLQMYKVIKSGTNRKLLYDFLLV